MVPAVPPPLVISSLLDSGKLLGLKRDRRAYSLQVPFLLQTLFSESLSFCATSNDQRIDILHVENKVIRNEEVRSRESNMACTSGYKVPIERMHFFTSIQYRTIFFSTPRQWAKSIVSLLLVDTSR